MTLEATQGTKRIEDRGTNPSDLSKLVSLCFLISCLKILVRAQDAFLRFFDEVKEVIMAGIKTSGNGKCEVVWFWRSLNNDDGILEYIYTDEIFFGVWLGF